MGLKEHVQSAPGGTVAHWIAKAIVRFVQFVLAVTVAGIYGSRIHSESLAGQSSSPQWLYAVVIAGLSAVTATVYGIPFVKSYLFCAWDAILFVLWIAVFGTFGKIYISRPDGVSNEYQGTDTDMMKHVVWVDLVNALLWAMTAAYGATLFLRTRGAKSVAPAHSEV